MHLCFCFKCTDVQYSNQSTHCMSCPRWWWQCWSLAPPCRFWRAPCRLKNFSRWKGMVIKHHPATNRFFFFNGFNMPMIMIPYDSQYVGCMTVWPQAICINILYRVLTMVVKWCRRMPNWQMYPSVVGQSLNSEGDPHHQQPTQPKTPRVAHVPSLAICANGASWKKSDKIADHSLLGQPTT